MDKAITIIVLFLVIASCKTATKTNLSAPTKDDRKLICELILLDSQYLDIVLINQTNGPLSIPPALGANYFQVYITNPSGKPIGPGYKEIFVRNEILGAGQKKIIHIDYLDFIAHLGNGKETGNYTMEFIIEKYGIHESQQVYFDYEEVIKY